MQTTKKMPTTELNSDFSKKCFVCNSFLTEVKQKNTETNLPVCDKCKDTEKEKLKVKEVFDSLADGFVCGCI